MRLPAERYVIQLAHGRVSFRFSQAALAGIGAGVFIILGMMALAIMLGDFPIPIADIYRTVLRIGDDQYAFIVRDLRLTRILVAVLVGTSLALAGATFQRVARNPLASPDVLGVTTGASFTATLAIVGGWSLWSIGASAAFGGMVTSAVVYALAYRNGLAPTRLILVGIGVTAALSGGITYMLTRTQIYTAQQAVEWQAGSLALSSWGDVRLVACAFGILLPVILLLDRRLSLLELGGDLAASLGLQKERAQLFLLGSAAMLVGLAVAASGPIAFVALIAPHAARGLLGRLDGGAMVVAALFGGLLLLCSDIVAQHLMTRSIPAGAVTAAVGTPYFLFIIYRGARAGNL